MRQARALLPYAIAGVFVAAASSAAIVLSLGGGGTPRQSEGPAGSAAPTAAPSRIVTDLSPNGRLAYWRNEPNGDNVLWVSNVDGSLRRGIGKTEDLRRITKTRWTTDGTAVAWIDAGTRLVVARVDGTQITIPMPLDARTNSYRIVDHRWSPDGTRVAATFQRQIDGRNDVYIAQLGGGWTRATAIDNVIAADWVTDDQLLVQETSGVVALLRADTLNGLRPITGLQATSPILGDDGRIYFLVGRVATLSGDPETLVLATTPSVWSTTVDGDEPRRDVEQLSDSDSLRLDSRWPGGAFLVHAGTQPAQLVRGTGAPQLPATAGLVQRLKVSADHRLAIGFTPSGIVRLDIPASPNAALGVVLLLGSIADGDAWFPRTAPLARAAAKDAPPPAVRYAFILGGNVWTMGPDGQASLLRAGSANLNTLVRFQVPTPAWSSRGDRILTVEAGPASGNVSRLTAVTIDRTGRATRYDAPSSIGRSPSWSPDGGAIAVVELPAGLQDSETQGGDQTVRFIATSGGSVPASIPGREAAWTRAGVFVVSNGVFNTETRVRGDQAVELWNGGTRRTITSAVRLLADPRAQNTADGHQALLSGLGASPDGALVAIRISWQGNPAGPFLLALVRASDGQPLLYLPGDRTQDETWSPTRALLGYTATVPGASNLRGVGNTATVRDVLTGEIRAQLDGRFAGWSPDGTLFYVARPTGLYAYRVGSSVAVRVSAVGALVSTTTP